MKNRRVPRYRDRPRDLEYMGWIKKLPCVVCMTRKDVEAAHVGERAYSRKCPDRETIPLCLSHHTQAPDAQHNLGKGFWEHHGIKRDLLIRALNNAYDELHKVTPQHSLGVAYLIVQAAVLSRHQRNEG